MSSQRLFPTAGSFAIFSSYISLFVSQGLLVKAVQKSEIRGFNAIVLVLLTELVKLLICLAVYFIRSQGNLLADIKRNNKLLMLYFVPSFLYCLYNNLTYINLQLFDLTTYYCLMQFRIVLTAIIYQILFRRQLTRTQWLSLIILTVGCLIKEYGYVKYDNLQSNQQQREDEILNKTLSTGAPTVIAGATTTHIPFIFKPNDYQLITNNHSLWLPLLLLLQMFCSCFAGVYTEFLLKDLKTSNNADVILQNIFMYLDSILCNLFVFSITITTAGSNNQPKNTTEPAGGELENFADTLNDLLTRPLVIILILNNALSGLVASFFLKSLNSILKTFASALELFAIAFLAWVLFDDKIDIFTMAALVLVSAAMVVYSRNPVSVAPPGRNSSSYQQGQYDDKDGFMLVPTSEQDQDHQEEEDGL